MRRNNLFVVTIVVGALIVTGVNGVAKRKNTQSNSKRKQTQADAPLPEYDDDYEYSEVENGNGGGKPFANIHVLLINRNAQVMIINL